MCSNRKIGSIWTASLFAIQLGCTEGKETDLSHRSIGGNEECTAEKAYDFMYPVNGASNNVPDLSVDPREDGWYVWNCYGNTCSDCQCVDSAGCVEEIHSGEDWNLVKERTDPNALECARSADLGEYVYAAANGTVETVRNLGGLFWAVVIRHDLPKEVDITSYLYPGTTVPDREKMVNTVYTLYLHVNNVLVDEGDCVPKGAVIAQIANLAGGPHLHFEVNRPSPDYIDALNSDPPTIAATRSGYYTSYQSMVDFGHISASKFIRDHRLMWHPLGTVVSTTNGLFILDREDGHIVRRPITLNRIETWRWGSVGVVNISKGEVDCYDVGSPIEEPPQFELYRTTTNSTVYRVNLDAQVREPFISPEALYSWGYDFVDVVVYDPLNPAHWWTLMSYGAFPIGEFLRLRDGAVFRTISDAPVYVVSERHARHVVDQPLFFDLGYRDELVLWVGDGTEAEVTLGIDAEINFDSIHQCENGRKERSTADCNTCSDMTEDGGGGECTDLDSDGYDDEDCGGTDCDDSRANVHPNAPEICDGRDNNCMNGTDELTDFETDDQNCGECGNVCGGQYHCVDGDCEQNGCTNVSQCNDGIACTNDSCEWTNTCRNNPDDSNCPDGQYCHESLDCVDTSVCTEDEDCDDGESTCTDDDCSNGLCHNTPNDNRCDWGHYCDPITATCAYSDTDGDLTVDVEDCRPHNPNIHPGAQETCNNIDDDCDGSTDEGLLNACGECGPLPTETCDGEDNDCDGQTDEGVLNACGRCGPVPAEVCGNNVDDNCNGSVDEDCVQIQVCNPTPEVCNGLNDDCDNQIDEGLGSTICGFGICRRTVNNCQNGIPQNCTPGPSQPESCNNQDDDCDGTTDESLTQACSTACGNGTQTCANGIWGTCSARQPSLEVCDNTDNDCDGSTDEGVTNACGQCGPVPIESCNGIDDDCDGSIDEAGVCGGCGLPNTVIVEVDSGSNGVHTLLTDLEGAGPDCTPEWEPVTDDSAPYEWTFEGDNGPRIVTYQDPNNTYFVYTIGGRGGDCETQDGWTISIQVNGINVPVPAYEPGNPVEAIPAGSARLAHEEFGWCNLMVCLGNNPCEANCQDGLDNDGDALADCLDWDCHWFWSNGACP